MAEERSQRKLAAEFIVARTSLFNQDRTIRAADATTHTGATMVQTESLGSQAVYCGENSGAIPESCDGVIRRRFGFA